MKKIIYFVFLCMGIAMMVVLSGNIMVHADGKTEQKKEQKDKKKIVCMIFPQYDWIVNILGEEIEEYEITVLLDDGSELHSYQPTVEDIAEISNCDFLFYVGGESDLWVKDALKSAKNPHIKAVSLLEILEDYAKKEEEIEGAIGHKHGEEGEHHGEEAHHEEYDEHMWLSLRNAELVLDTLSAELSEMSPEDAKVYEENKAQYQNQLKNLDEKYRERIEAAEGKVILFGDRFPFRYLADDYGLSYYAAFDGCSAEVGVSFETIIFLAKKVDEYHLPAVFVMENTDQQLARAIIENTIQKNQKILTLHSMQSVTREQMEEEDFSYVGVMEKNLEILERALTGKDCQE